MQIKCNQRLPNVIKNWNFLPLALRSLKPYDDQIKKLKCCAKLTNKEKESNQVNLEMKITQ
jgi:hypothetical protein